MSLFHPTAGETFTFPFVHLENVFRSEKMYVCDRCDKIMIKANMTALKAVTMLRRGLEMFSVFFILNLSTAICCGFFLVTKVLIW